MCVYPPTEQDMTIAGFPGRPTEEGCGSEYTLESLAVEKLRLVVGVCSITKALVCCRLRIAVRRKVFQFAEHQACDAGNFVVNLTFEGDKVAICDWRRGRAGFFGFVA